MGGDDYGEFHIDQSRRLTGRVMGLQSERPIFLAKMKSTIREVTRSRTKKARVFVTLRVISWIVSVIETREKFKMAHYQRPSSSLNQLTTIQPAFFLPGND